MSAASAREPVAPSAPRSFTASRKVPSGFRLSLRLQSRSVWIPSLEADVAIGLPGAVVVAGSLLRAPARARIQLSNLMMLSDARILFGRLKSSSSGRPCAPGSPVRSGCRNRPPKDGWQRNEGHHVRKTMHHPLRTGSAVALTPGHSGNECGLAAILSRSAVASAINSPPRPGLRSLYHKAAARSSARASG